MRPWIKWSLAAVAVIVLAFAALAGTGAYYFLRNLETRSASETDSRAEFDSVRARFKDRAPLLVIADLQNADVRVNRSVHPEGRRAETLHVLNWNREDGRLMRASVPLWLMRFSSVNILSELGLAPERFRLTVDDLAAYGPGIVADYQKAGEVGVIVWVE
jgi:hypothetical protein